MYCKLQQRMDQWGIANGHTETFNHINLHCALSLILSSTSFLKRGPSDFFEFELDPTDIFQIALYIDPCCRKLIFNGDELPFFSSEKIFFERFDIPDYLPESS